MQERVLLYILETTNWVHFPFNSEQSPIVPSLDTDDGLLVSNCSKNERLSGLAVYQPVHLPCHFSSAPLHAMVGNPHILI